MSKVICTADAPEAIGPYSQAVIVGSLVFTSGQIPINPATGCIDTSTITEQTHQICQNLSAVLKAAGSSLEKAVKTVCYLSDMDNFAQFNEVYAQYFTSKPARSCVAVKALPKGSLAEIEVIAELDDTNSK